MIINSQVQQNPIFEENPDIKDLRDWSNMIVDCTQANIPFPNLLLLAQRPFHTFVLGSEVVLKKWTDLKAKEENSLIKRQKRFFATWKHVKRW